MYKDSGYFFLHYFHECSVQHNYKFKTNSFLFLHSRRSLKMKSKSVICVLLELCEKL